MREIKFRAWNGAQMLYRDLHDRNWYNRGNKCVKGVHPSDRNQLQVSEFTGLQDSKGQDIYEGDILKSDIGDTGKVVFNIRWACFQLTFRGKDGFEYSISANEWYSTSGKGGAYDVIGNIHENKDFIF